MDDLKSLLEDLDEVKRYIVPLLHEDLGDSFYIFRNDFKNGMYFNDGKFLINNDERFIDCENRVRGYYQLLTGKRYYYVKFLRDVEWQVFDKENESEQYKHAFNIADGLDRRKW